MRAPNEPAERRLKRIFGLWTARAFLALMWLGSALITVMSLPYFDFETLPPFVIEKLPLRFEALWLGALRIHVAAAALSFPLCLLLMSRALQRRASWHRFLGRVTGGLAGMRAAALRRRARVRRQRRAARNCGLLAFSPDHRGRTADRSSGSTPT